MRIRGLLAVSCSFLLAPCVASAAGISVDVRGQNGKPVEWAVVHATPVSGGPGAGAGQVDIDQVDKQYVPYVTAVRTGTKINFPNHDQIRHHVYSFSPAKSFEIPLYKGIPREPVHFSQPGIVTLGCNIHDWMKAYVYVTDAPHHAVTDASGRATLANLPADEFNVEVWHPQLKGDSAGTRKRVALDGSDQSLEVVIDQKRVWRPRRAPSSGGGAAYR